MANTTERSIRGSVAWVPVLTGVVVALGAMLLLSAAVGAFLVIIDALPVDGDEAAELGIGGSIALVIGLFLSYLWGGYTAGRMARGQGIRNGLLVALGALLVALAAAGGARAADLNTNLNVPWTSDRLPIEEEVIVDWGVLLGVASLLAMAAGGAYGGYRGVKWHTALEEKAVEEKTEEKKAEDPSTAETPAATGSTGVFRHRSGAPETTTVPPPAPGDTDVTGTEPPPPAPPDGSERTDTPPEDPPRTYR